MPDVLSMLMMIKSSDVDQSVILNSELDFLYTFQIRSQSKGSSLLQVHSLKLN